MKPGNAGMEMLIPAMNKIFDVCTQVGVNMEFDFPVIAVIGSQSAGKSSVLENFVGRDFLPRGTGIITRRPLILQLISDSEEYGVFIPNKDKNIPNNEKRFTNFDEIRKEIFQLTESIAGNNKGISAIPINLHIHSPNVLNLTLIDLPGITKVPLGDQPVDIEQQVKDMILQYISKKNCLILAVTPANADLATSDALKLAKEVDPDGVRTIGVITKLDLMDEGTNARDILGNKLLPLHRGYIGVVNRSQKHIEDKKDISTALKAERDFLMRHYRHFADRMGTPHLQRVLNQQLSEHILKKLPSLRDELSKRMVTTRKEVEEFNNLYHHHSSDDDDEIMKKLMLKIIHKIQSDFEKAIGGLGSEDIRTEGLSNGAIICRIFLDRLSRDVWEIAMDSEKMRREINFAISGIYGYRVPLFEPYMVFEHIVKKEIIRLKQPVLNCIDLVVEELTSAVRNCTQNITDYPNLRGDIENNIISFIHNNGPKIKQSILSLIEMELAYMNIQHVEFMNNFTNGETGSSRLQNSAVHDSGRSQNESSLKIGNMENSRINSPDNENVCSLGDEVATSDQEDENGEKNEITEKEDLDPSHNQTVDNIYEKIDSYMRIVRKTTCDMIPKAITLYGIKEVQNYINDTLIMKFIGLPNDEYSYLFALSPEKAEKHENNTKTYEACTAALDIIRTVTKDISAKGVIANANNANEVIVNGSTSNEK